MTMFHNLQRMMGPQQTLKIECGRCGRRVAWAAEKAMDVFGPWAQPADVRRRLTCTACKAPGQATVWI